MIYARFSSSPPLSYIYVCLLCMKRNKISVWYARESGLRRKLWAAWKNEIFSAFCRYFHLLILLTPLMQMINAEEKFMTEFFVRCWCCFHVWRRQSLLILIFMLFIHTIVKFLFFFVWWVKRRDIRDYCFLLRLIATAVYVHQSAWC